MDYILIPVMGIIFAIGLPVIFGFILWNQYNKGKNAERMAMIERGVIPDEIVRPEKRSNRYPALRNGLFMIGIALGAIIGILMGPVLVINGWIDFTVVTMAVLFGGIAFVIYFFLARRLEQEEDKKQHDRLS
ncbi:hypothetical protein LJC35_06735 [Parabacteroides sp. OttesenSCG-928-N08]|nr:hypothetical protein [Parabacteroides sp. OttesenSCG-928-N08]